MKWLRRNKDGTVVDNLVSSARKEFPIFVGISATVVILNIILLVMFGGWWIFFFPIAALPHILYLYSSFYIKLSSISGLTRKTLLGSAIYGIIFPLIYIPAILDSSEYSYILLGLRPGPDALATHLISSTSPYAWMLLGISSGIVFAGVLFIYITKRRTTSKSKK